MSKPKTNTHYAIMALKKKIRELEEENENLKRENEYMKSMLEAKNKE